MRKEQQTQEQDLTWLKIAFFSFFFSIAYFLLGELFNYFTYQDLLESKYFKSTIRINYFMLNNLGFFSIVLFFLTEGRTLNFVERFLSRITFFTPFLIAISPLLETAENFYFQYDFSINENIFYIWSIVIFLITLFCLSIFYCFFYFFSFSKIMTLQFSLFRIAKLCMSLVIILIILCFIFSFLNLYFQSTLEIIYHDMSKFYKAVFYSGSFLCKFLFAQAIMLMWFYLAFLFTRGNLFYYLYYKMLFLASFLIALSSSYSHIVYNVVDIEFFQFYNLYLAYFIKIIPVLFILGLFYEIFSFVVRQKNFQLYIRDQFLLLSIIFSGIAFTIKDWEVTDFVAQDFYMIGFGGACYIFFYIIFYSKYFFENENFIIKDIFLVKNRYLPRLKICFFQIYSFVLGKFLCIFGNVANYISIDMKKAYSYYLMFNLFRIVYDGGVIFILLSGFLFTYICFYAFFK